MKPRLGILLSGQGTNFQAIWDQVRSGKIVAEIGLVISNEKEAYGLVRAREADLPHVWISHRDFPTRESFDLELIRQLDEARIDLVVLAGFMRLLSKKFVEHYRGRVMNIHPALLPSFPGTNSIKRAWESGVKETGVTVHFVDEGIDTGPIILQKAVPIEEGESLKDLTQKIHDLEHTLYPEAIRLYLEGRFQEK